MSTELEQTPAILPHPLTGEVVELAGPIDLLGDWLLASRDAISQIRDMQRIVQDEVLNRQDHEASWTTREGGLEIVGQAPGGVEYDTAALRATLDGLVKTGQISQKAADAAIKWAPSASLSGVKALKKLGGSIAEAVTACERPKARRVTVRRNA